jgi:hypothetical protein
MARKQKPALNGMMQFSICTIGPVQKHTEFCGKKEF